MKITDLFNQEWSQDTQNFADVMIESILQEENSRLVDVQHAAIFRELVCEAITNSTGFELTPENENRLITTAAIYSTFISMTDDGQIIIAEDAEGEEVVLFRN